MSQPVTESTPQPVTESIPRPKLGCSPENKINRRDLDPNYLPITYESLDTPTKFCLPRRYTSTHDDATKQIFVAVGKEYNKTLLSSEEVKTVESQVLGSWHHSRKGYKIIFTVWVSTKRNPQAEIRNRIFCSEMNKVLQGVALAETALLCAHPKLAKTKIYVRFVSFVDPKYERTEKWGTLGYWR